MSQARRAESDDWKWSQVIASPSKSQPRARRCVTSRARRISCTLGPPAQSKSGCRASASILRAGGRGRMCATRRRIRAICGRLDRRRLARLRSNLPTLSSFSLSFRPLIAAARPKSEDEDGRVSHRQHYVAQCSHRSGHHSATRCRRQHLFDTGNPDTVELAYRRPCQTQLPGPSETCEH